MNLKENRKRAHSRWILPAFALAAAVTAALVFLLLDPFADTEDESMIPTEVLDPSVHGAVPEPVTDAKEDSPGRAAVLPGGEEGGVARISGLLRSGDAPLAGVKVLAFADSGPGIPPMMRSRIRSSLIYYSAAGQELRSLARELGLLGEEGGAGPAPVASAETGPEGRFTLILPRCERLSFGLDHAFYYLPVSQAGPYAWPEDAAVPPEFEGRLEAELGSAVEVTVTDLDEYPIEGADVFLGLEEGAFFQGGGPFFGSTPDRAAGGFRGKTDDRGGIRFQGVPAREGYVVEVRKEGCAPARTEPIQARAGETHAVRVRLGEGTTFRVRVRGPGGAALSGAEVFVLKVRGAGSSPGRGPWALFNGSRVQGHGETDADGTWLCRAVPPGKYTVRAGFPGRLEAETVDPLEVTETPRVMAVNLTLGTGLSVSGRVVDDRNRPVAGAEVLARKHKDQGGFFGGMSTAMEVLSVPRSMEKKAVTDDHGAFRITGLAEGARYDVAAGRRGYLPAAKEKVLPGAVDVLLVLDRPGVVSGKAISAITAEPVKRFKVRILPAPGKRERNSRPRGMNFVMDRLSRSRNRSGPGSRDPFREFFSRMMDRVLEKDYFSPPRLTSREEAFKSREGRFELDDVVPGRYRLCVYAQGYAPALTDPFEVKKGDQVQGMVVSLGPGASVEGKVVSDEGGVPGARVSVEAERGSPSDLRILLDTVEGGLSDPEGRFSIKSLPAGTLRLRAEHPDHPDVRSDPLELGEGRAVTGLVLRFPPGARIIGTVLDGEGKPLSGQTVTCREAGGRWSREVGRDTTDKEGRFEIKGLREGTFRVALRSGFRGFGPSSGAGGSVEVALAAGQTQEVVLTRTPPEGAVVHGLVSDGTELITAGFITVSPVSGRGRRGSFRSGPIASDGSYRIEGVQPGRNRFSLRFPYGDGFESASLEFDIPDLGDVLLDIYLPGGRIEGLVLDGATGRPLSGVEVTLVRAGASNPALSSSSRRRGPFRWGGDTRATAEDGAFLFRFLEAGTYDLEARPGSGFEGDRITGYYPAVLQGVTLVAHQVRQGLRLVLAPAGGISVTVRDKNGAPVVNASVTALEETTPEGSAPARIRGRTAEDGVAEVKGLRPGSYSLWVQSRSAGEKALGGLLVSPGGFTPVNVTLDKGFEITVRLSDSEGKPVTGASLTLRSAQGALIPVSGRSRGSSSRYFLGRLPAGAYTLEARWKGQTGTGTFTVSAPGTLPVKIR